MSAFVFAPRAIADLEEIWGYTVEHWGIHQAEIYVREIEGAIKTLAADPEKGRACDDVRAGYRKYPVASHLVFYRVTESGIAVVRILHRRMDSVRHF